MAKHCQLARLYTLRHCQHSICTHVRTLYHAWPRLNVGLTCLLNSPCIHVHRFFVNLSDSLSFALLSSEAVSLFPVYIV